VLALWPVGAQGARAQTQPRTQRRRHVVQRSTAVAAQFRPGRVNAQPQAARLAVWVDALYGPAWQVLHGTPTLESRESRPWNRESWRDSGTGALACQGKNTQLVVVVFQTRQALPRACSPRRHSLRPILFWRGHKAWREAMALRPVG